MRKLQMIFMSLAVMFLATPAFAQGTLDLSATQWVSIAAGIGMGLAAGLCGIGQGNATASATLALARNPGARPGIFIFLVLGLAFIESLALFTFVMIFLKVKPLKLRAPGSCRTRKSFRNCGGFFCFWQRDYRRATRSRPCSLAR